MNIYLKIGYVISMTGFSAIASLLWTLYAFDLVNIGWGQPLMVTIMLAVLVWAYAVIQLSQPSEAEVLKARLEFKQAELARQVRTRKINTAIDTIPNFPKSY